MSRSRRGFICELLAGVVYSHRTAEKGENSVSVLPSTLLWTALRTHSSWLLDVLELGQFRRKLAF